MNQKHRESLTIQFIKIRDVESPQKAYPETDAGFDWFCPNDFETVVLSPGKSVLIPSGIQVIVPDGYCLSFMNKSGVASKKKLLVGAQIVDTDYFGEVHLNLHNVGEESVIINPGMKLVQSLILPVPLVEFEEILASEYNAHVKHIEFTKSKSRGTGGFGSTGESK